MTFWKQARGDHILSSIFASSLISAFLSAHFILSEFSDTFKMLFIIFGSLLGMSIPALFAPDEWINNELPAGHFWRDALT